MHREAERREEWLSALDRGARRQHKENMKRILFFIIVMLLAVSSASGQNKTFIEFGLAGSYGSNNREKSFPEVYGTAGFKLFEFKESTAQLRARGIWSERAQYADLFTRDNNPERKASGQLIVSPEIRWNLSTESYFKPFIAAGAEYTRHFGLPNKPNHALTPTLTFGTRVGYGYEVSYTRLFEDWLGPSKLRGDRIGASYTLKLSGKFHFKFGAEADYVSFRACSNVDCDGYREYDLCRPAVRRDLNLLTHGSSHRSRTRIDLGRDGLEESRGRGRLSYARGVASRH